MGSSVRTLWRQFRVLSHKNYLLAIRNWKGTVGQLLSPLFIVLLLLGFQQLSDFVLSRDQEFPPSSSLETIPKCIERNSVRCWTLVYAPENCEWCAVVVAMVAEESGLDISRDVMKMGQGAGDPLQFEKDNATLYNYIIENQNATQNAILFTGAYELGNGGAVPGATGYIMFYNSTFAANNQYYSPVMQVMRAVDQAILRMKTKKDGARLDVTTQSFPRAKLRVSGYDVVAANGGIYFYIPPMITFFIILTEIVVEKEQRLRLGMQMMGLKNIIYWVTWLLTSLSFIVMSTLILIFAGMACQFSVFLNSNFFAVFLLFFLFGIAVSSIAFMLSTIIRKSATAQTLGYSIVLIGFVFQSILCSGYGILVDLLFSKDVAAWVVFVRWVFIMYPPFNLAKGYSDIAALSSSTIDIAQGNIIKGKGFYWSDLFKARDIGEVFDKPLIVPPPITSYYYLMLNAAIFLTLTWYFDNILPGENGTPKPFYFFLTPSYWGFDAKMDTSSVLISDVDVEEMDQGDSDVETEAIQASSMDTEGAAIRVVNLSKAYRKQLWKSKKDVLAVNQLSFTVQKGEIFCLLGHNGAGKTTTINMLTGLFAADSGLATIFGKSIVTEMDDIRKSMGVCPQHDILWNELTAKEHLRIFARLKGLSAEETEEEATAKLKQMGLEHVSEKRAGTFSGGMKRRLSVAVAAIGNPAVIFMDEPSTGMDPVNRRGLWNLIQEMKQNAAIVLTTHSMEEADVLGDRISIMAFGKMRCIGNALHLKNKYGSGYRINATTTTDKVEKLLRAVMSTLPETTVGTNDAGNLTLHIPENSVQKAPDLLRLLEKEAASDGLVHEWGISHTTLEEVFLNITKKYDFVYEEDDGVELSPLHGRHQKETAQRGDSAGTSSYPYRALIRKNFSLQGRQKGTNFCQILTPVLVMGILLLLQLVIRSELHGKVDQRQLIPSLPWPLNVDAQDFVPRTQLDDDFDFVEDDDHHNHTRANCLEFFFFADVNQQAGHLDSNGSYGGLLGKIAQRNCVVGGTKEHVPYFLERDDQKAMNAEVFEILTEYNSKPLDKVRRPPLMYELPDGFMDFNNIDVDSAVIDYSFAVNDNNLVAYHRKNNFTRMDLEIPDIDSKVVADYELIILEGKLAAMSMIHDAFQRTVLNEDAPTPDIFNTKFAQRMPYFAVADILVAIEIVGTLLYPVALTIQLPIYIYILVLEKAEKLRELMKSHGMRMTPYIVTNYLFYMLLYGTAIAFFWLSGLAIGIRFFKQTDPVVLLVFFFGWGNALITLAFFLSAFLNSKRAATVIGYIIALIGSLVALVICVGIYGNFAWAVSTKMPTAYLIWPQFAFVRGIYLMNYVCAENYACYGSFSTFGMNNELSSVLIFLYADAALFLILYLYFEAVLPREYGVKKHPLFFLLPLFHWVKKFSKKTPATSYFPIDQGSTSSYDSMLMFEHEHMDEDEDVREERERVHQGHYDPMKCPLVIHDLGKVYPSSPPKVAVHSLCVGIPQGQCFGMLGENGAGKTTTIAMVTGFLPPSSGHALVGGYNILSEMDKVHLVIGVCPQFSVLWDGLTVREHLLFYARVKGVSPSSEKAHIQSSLQDFGLVDSADKLAQDLSGGMQRRLSVAIALVGHSEIVFLDEPTTGLDPASRRQLWKIIHRAKEGRAIVLTTHSMEEAEVLCGRIGIVVEGKLRCIGTPVHLKNKWATGYRLTVNFNAGDANNITRAVTSLFPDASESASYKGTKEFTLSARMGRIGEVFETMQQQCPVSITDWSISQSGLEEVFQRIVHEGHSHSDSKQEHGESDVDSGPLLRLSSKLIVN